MLTLKHIGISLAITSLCSLTTLSSYANTPSNPRSAADEFAQWRQQTKETFQQYLDENDRAFIGFLKESWDPVELAKEWRSDRALRKLEAILAVADHTASLIITGNGDVLQPEDDLIGVGSGGNYALSAARALLDNTELSAKDIVEKSLKIAGDICVFTNGNLTIETLNSDALTAGENA